METALGQVGLPQGIPMALRVVEGPDAEWAPRLAGLLGHKPPVYLGHVTAALERPLDGLQTLFYVGCVGPEPITVAMVVGAHGAGVLGHVYTVPEWRRRGASSQLLSVLWADAQARGYRVLTLGTNPEGHARRMYEVLGFRQVEPGSGSMRLCLGPDADAPPVTPPAAGPVRWDDWGWVSAAAAVPLGVGESLPRSRALGLRGPGHVEGDFIHLLQTGAPLFVVRRGALAVGWASLSSRDLAALGAVALDFYVRPDCAADAATLLAGIPWPGDRPVVCAPGGSGGHRAEALAAAGFQPGPPQPGLDGLVLWVRGLRSGG